MEVTSIYFYVISMAVFWLTAALLTRMLPATWRHESRQPEGGRLTTLDGLRGVLALSVTVSHILLYNSRQVSGAWVEVPSRFYAQMGVMPVTLFFFITGYLFWTKSIRRRKLSPVAFYRDRLARLGPAYWFAFVCFCLLVAIVGRLRLQVSFSLFVAQCFGWLSFLGAGHDFNGLKDSRWWLGQVWTLRLEWMFYILLPFLTWFARRPARIVLLIGTAVALSLSMDKVHIGGPAGYTWSAFINFLNFLYGTFSIGMIVAAVPFSERAIKFAQSKLATVVSAMLIVLTALWIPPKYGMVESALLAFPFACVCLGNRWFGVLTSEPMRLAGRVSYSIYLLHTIVLETGMLLLARWADISTMHPVPYWAFGIACGSGAIVISCVSWQFLERPFLSWLPAATLGRLGNYSYAVVRRALLSLSFAKDVALMLAVYLIRSASLIKRT
jgi:peptidoglycan/LPS O-acetylase OafA/YrhL